jgi:hypothetical protein
VQREEMQRHREAAKRTMDRRKTQPSETRMSYIQNILHSVQVNPHEFLSQIRLVSQTLINIIGESLMKYFWETGNGPI